MYMWVIFAFLTVSGGHWPLLSISKTSQYAFYVSNMRLQSINASMSIYMCISIWWIHCKCQQTQKQNLKTTRTSGNREDSERISLQRKIGQVHRSIIPARMAYLPYIYLIYSSEFNQRYTPIYLLCSWRSRVWSQLYQELSPWYFCIKRICLISYRI